MDSESEIGRLRAEMSRNWCHGQFMAAIEVAKSLEEGGVGVDMAGKGFVTVLL